MSIIHPQVTFHTCGHTRSRTRSCRSSTGFQFPKNEGKSYISDHLDLSYQELQDLGLNLVSILDNLRIPQVIGLGDGAGANIITR